MNTEESAAPELSARDPEASEGDALPPELLEKIPKEEREAFAQKLHSLGIEFTREEHYTGPLLPPNLAAGWNDLLPGSAERIFHLYEQKELKKIEANDRILAIAEQKFRKDSELEKQKHDDSVSISKSVIDRNLEIAKRGQFIGAVGALLIGAIAFYLIHEGNSGWGIAVVIAEIVAFAGVFVVQEHLRRNQLLSAGKSDSDPQVMSDYADSNGQSAATA